MNAYALRTAEGTALVDAGNPGDGRTILSLLEAIGLPPPSLVLLTHADLDHAGGARELLRLCAPAVCAPEREAELLAGRGRPRLLRRLGRIPTGRIRCTALRDGERACGLLVVSSPGHTQGHCAYLREQDGVLFSGDALAVRGGLLRIPAMPFTEDWPRAYSSLLRLSELRPALVLPGHGQPLPDPAKAFALAIETEREPRSRFSPRR